MNGRGCVPNCVLVKLYLQEQAEGCIWPRVAHRLSPLDQKNLAGASQFKQQAASQRTKGEDRPSHHQGFLNFAHPDGVQGSMGDLLSVKDSFCWVTPEFEIPAVPW